MTALPAASITSSAFDDLDALNAQLEGLHADQRVAWALQHGPQNAALSSSFGAQSAVTLHLLSQQRPDI
ncbi:phosphoadenosine phosphosulfate reductase, partial [Xanthomonas perforans]|nr:phosphoadenosine phosphosulfate reductase [Xanthomonas perforans]